jgi:hypothetical protein
MISKKDFIKMLGKMTQRELAIKSGLNPYRLNRVINGKERLSYKSWNEIKKHLPTLAVINNGEI